MRLLLALIALALAAHAHAALPAFARFTGTLQGQSRIGDFPAFTWTLVATPPVNHQKTATLLLASDALRLRIDLQIDLHAESIAWRIDDARLPLAPLAAVLAPRFAPSLSSIAFSGELHLSGSGTIVDNRPRGRLSISCVNASASDALEGWTLSGVDFSGEFSLGENLAVASASPATLRIQTIATSRFGARNFSASGHLVSLARASISHAKVEIAGGEVETLEPFTVPLSPPSLAALIQIRRVGLQDFLALLPSGLADARGKLNGDLRLTWNKIEGIQLSPDGDARHRTAHVEVDARPLQPGSVIKRVTFDINVSGPLASLFRLGFNHPFSLTVR